MASSTWEEHRTTRVAQWSTPPTRSASTLSPTPSARSQRYRGLQGRRERLPLTGRCMSWAAAESRPIPPTRWTSMIRALTLGQPAGHLAMRGATSRPTPTAQPESGCQAAMIVDGITPLASMEIFCAAGATPTPTPTPTATPTVTPSATPTGNTFGDTNSDTNGDPIADRHAQSDAATTPDTVSSADAVARSWNSLCGNSRKKLASSRGGANALNLRALSEE